MRFALLSILVAGSLSLKAQSSIDLNLARGFAWSLGTQVGGDEIYETVQATKKNRLNYGLANGSNWSLQGTHQTDSSPFVLGLAVDYFNGNQERYAENANDSLRFLSVTTLQNKRISINPSVGIKYNIFGSENISSIGLIMPVYSRTTESSVWGLEMGNSGNENRTVYYSFSPGLFLSHKTELIKKGKFGMGLQAQLGLLSLTRNRKRIDSYSDSDGNSLETVFPNESDRTLNYINPNSLEQGQKLNDPVFNPSGFDPSKAKEAFEYNENMSFFGFGIYFRFKI